LHLSPGGFYGIIWYNTGTAQIFALKNRVRFIFSRFNRQASKRHTGDYYVFLTSGRELEKKRENPIFRIMDDV